MIEISTMTTIFRVRRENNSFIPYPESIRRCKAAGFDVLDLNICSMSNAAENELCGDDWEKILDEIIEEKERQGIRFYQTHPPFRSGHIIQFDDAEKEKFFWDMEYRALDITARIGAKWAVIHPVFIPGERDWDKQIAHNHKVFDPLVEYASKLGIGIAFENMPEFGNVNHQFTTYPEEIIAICDAYNCDTVGLCWDFGHANTACSKRHAEGLRSLGKRLKCVHIHDNLGLNDDHFLPFRGNIPWEELMPILTEIGYEGTLNLELRLNRMLPDELKDEGARLMYSIVKKLQQLTLK